MSSKKWLMSLDVLTSSCLWLPRLNPLYELLYQRIPDYTSLKVFGSQCFPCIRTILIDKLSAKSLACIFIGYNAHHKGYKCLHVPLGKIFIS